MMAIMEVVLMESFPTLVIRWLLREAFSAGMRLFVDSFR